MPLRVPEVRTMKKMSVGFILLLLLDAAAVSQSNQEKKLDYGPDHGKIVWQFDTKG